MNVDETKRAAHHSWVFEADLANVHAPILLQVRPRSVDDGDVVFLVA